MLKIRPSQFEAFRDVADAAFARRVAAHLRENNAEDVVKLPSGELALDELDDETLLRLVRAGVERARAYGMESESSLTAFVVLTFAVAPNFDAHPLIRRVLEDASIAPDLRLSELWGRTNEENWQAAADAYDPAAWGLPDVER